MAAANAVYTNSKMTTTARFIPLPSPVNCSTAIRRNAKTMPIDKYACLNAWCCARRTCVPTPGSPPVAPTACGRKTCHCPIGIHWSPETSTPHAHEATLWLDAVSARGMLQKMHIRSTSSTGTSRVSISLALVAHATAQTIGLQQPPSTARRAYPTASTQPALIPSPTSPPVPHPQPSAVACAPNAVPPPPG